jgi:hypothetical protein
LPETDSCTRKTGASTYAWLRGIGRNERDTIKRLLTPDITTLWVVGFILLCTFLLNGMVFQPILRIIDARATAVRGAKELAESASEGDRGRC